MKITKEGQPCRHCKTPVVKKTPKKRIGKSNSYFEYYLYCSGCKRIYMVESARRFYNDTTPVKIHEEIPPEDEYGFRWFKMRKMTAEEQKEFAKRKTK